MIGTLADIAMLTAALGALTFAVYYQVSTGGMWRRSPLGRNVMALMAAVAVLLSIAVVRAYAPIHDHLDHVRLVGFAVVSYIIWRRVTLLYQAQHSDGPPDDGEPPTFPPGRAARQRPLPSGQEDTP